MPWRPFPLACPQRKRRHGARKQPTEAGVAAAPHHRLSNEGRPDDATRHPARCHDLRCIAWNRRRHRGALASQRMAAEPWHADPIRRSAVRPGCPRASLRHARSVVGDRMVRRHHRAGSAGSTGWVLNAGILPRMSVPEATSLAFYAGWPDAVTAITRWPGTSSRSNVHRAASSRFAGRRATLWSARPRERRGQS
jgi:hypothetical protein